MKNVFAMLAAAGFLAIPQMAAAEDSAPASYEDAIRCAAVDTLISSVVGGDGATPENKKLSEYYDGVTERWLTRAGEGPGGQDKALADYLTASTGLVEKLSAVEEDGVEDIVSADLKYCLVLEATTFGTVPGN